LLEKDEHYHRNFTSTEHCSDFRQEPNLILGNLELLKNSFEQPLGVAPRGFIQNILGMVKWSQEMSGKPDISLTQLMPFLENIKTFQIHLEAIVEKYDVNR
jgi:hypothetical protein